MIRLSRCKDLEPGSSRILRKRLRNRLPGRKLPKLSHVPKRLGAHRTQHVAKQVAARPPRPPENVPRRVRNVLPQHKLERRKQANLEPLEQASPAKPTHSRLRLQRAPQRRQRNAWSEPPGSPNYHLNFARRCVLGLAVKLHVAIESGCGATFRASIDSSAI